MQRKALGIYGLVSSVPLLFILPGASEYPMTVIAGILTACVGLSMLPADELPEIPALPDKNKAKAASCPAGA